MGQRHNRRRTRPRSRNRNSSLAQVNISPSSLDLCAPACPHAFDCPGSPLASTRHYEWLKWQQRDLMLRPESMKLETEQYRLFGGEPGDDVDLCYRMLEYFDGLDYIDPSQALISSPG